MLSPSASGSVATMKKRSSRWSAASAASVLPADVLMNAG
jgi:hypothetical protein